MVTKKEISSNTNLNISVLKSIQETLCGHIFSGWLGEREWIEKLNNYRDVIEVDEWESIINSDLNSLILAVNGVNSGEWWINITGPSSSTPCYSLWVLLAELVPIGHYWFKIENILFDNTFGLNFVIKPIRMINTFDGETFDERIQRQRTINEIDPAEVWKEFISNMKIEHLQSIRNFMLTSLSPSTISAGFRLTLIMGMSFLVACKEICLFSLKFIHEVGLLIQRSTPLFESVFNFAAKIIGGILIFLTMIYNDLRNPQRRMPRPPHPDERHFEQEKVIRYIPPDKWQSQRETLS